MKRFYLILIIIDLGLPQPGRAQSTFDGFSKLFRYEGDSAERAEIINDLAYDSASNSIFFNMGSLRYSPGPSSKLVVFYRTDVQGNIIKKVVDSSTTFLGYYSVMVSKDGQSIYWGGQSEDTTPQILRLKKTDKDLNTIWERHYVMDTKNAIIMSITEDLKKNRLYILARKQGRLYDSLPEIHTQAEFIKLDTSGNLILRSHPGSHVWDDPHGMVRTRDGNFIISGRTIGWGHQNSAGVAFSMKVDTNGHELWHHLNSHYHAYWIMNNLNLGNGSYINVGTAVPVHNPSPRSNYGLFYPFVSRINESGQMEWEKYFKEDKFIGEFWGGMQSRPR